MENISWENRELEAKWEAFKKGIIFGFIFIGIPMFCFGYFYAMKAFGG